MKGKTITVRIGAKSLFQIEYLKRHLKEASTTQVIVKALSDLYETVKEEERRKSAFDLMDELGLIGCFDGEPGLSQNYKKGLNRPIPLSKRNLQV